MTGSEHLHTGLAARSSTDWTLTVNLLTRSHAARPERPASQNWVGVVAVAQRGRRLLRSSLGSVSQGCGSPTVTRAAFVQRCHQ
jgi:hypothetical protein